MWSCGRPEYFDICHPGTGYADLVLWVHDGKRLESKSAKGGAEHYNLWKGESYKGSGRVDTAKHVGILGLASGIERRLARKIVENVVAEFPGVKFWVFYESDRGVSVQEFWEATSTRGRRPEGSHDTECQSQVSI